MTLRTKILIDDMLDTMYEAYGVGLAAPQVGILKRLVVIDVGEGADCSCESGDYRNIRRADRGGRMFKCSGQIGNSYSTKCS